MPEPLFLDEDLQLLLAALRSGSLTRAARALDTTVSTVSRRLARLEERLGRALFLRNSDGLVPTPAAVALRASAEAAERAGLELDAAARSVHRAADAVVRLATTHDFAQLVLVPHLPALMAANPGLVLEVDVGPDLVDLGRQEADLALRVGTPGTDDRMLSRRLRDTPFSLFAPASLWSDAAGAPRLDPRALPWIDVGPAFASSPMSTWAVAYFGRPPVLRINDLGLMRQAAQAGLGAAVLPDVYGRVTPGLVEVMTVPELAPVPMFLVGHPASRRLPHVEAVWTFLVGLLGQPAIADLDVLRPALRRAYGWRYED
jgi:DNA-binding transcriptional LysR family regulator